MDQPLKMPPINKWKMSIGIEMDQPESEQPVDESDHETVAREVAKPDSEPQNPCRCTNKCETACNGTCGCRRCKEDYADFLSMEQATKRFSRLPGHVKAAISEYEAAR